ncbi:DUF5590 domain-containing protein [Paenibacillus xerothermodurans]|uniref:Cell wall elongation regulator TseB-like domain-containing protein n=1 Tax=Paenibacillus xerothermodurans TaxID=1977292 RepID=A0A2W1NBT8_PAEXE|nr:DUF5590 domain-containing protein [Paenibacillus xerothermodurans]PZE21907.1 hypothetical protein CBW46_005760 [Paenibacillus xerothermodurans]
MKIRIAAAAVVITSLLLFFSIRFVNSVQEDEWKIQRTAVLTAYEKTILTKVNKVERFVGEKPYTVIQGEDKIGHKMIVWVGEDSLHTQMASEGLAVENVEPLVLARQPGAEVLRSTPGILNGMFVWEVFYNVSSEESGDDRYYYDYYNFKDGSHIDTYRLSIQ